MNRRPTESKPWNQALAPAVAIPIAWWAGLIVADYFHCGTSRVQFMAMFFGLETLFLIAVALLLAAVIVALWRGRFPLRSWYRAIGVLVIAAAVIGMCLDLSDLHSRDMCHFDL